MSQAIPTIDAAHPPVQMDITTTTSENSKACWWRAHWAGLTLLGLTVFSGMIRFFDLAAPCLWYDEARVYYRVCGTYPQLLDCLRTDGFGPLHYQLYWLLVRPLSMGPSLAKIHFLTKLFPFLKNAPVFFPGPFMFRFIPALCGTLMVPAMYFLARQLLPIRTSLLAAAFTACSAFMIFYSRDAKMYMDTWLFVTLGMASLLWWFRTNLSTAWLCWIASSAIAGGIHATSSIALGLSAVFLFSQKTLRWQKALLWVLGMVLITAGPIGYYEKFNTWKDRVSEDWQKASLDWIPIYNQGRTGPQLTRYLGSSMLMGWEWPRDNSLRYIQPARVNVPIVLVTVLAIILLVAAFPWPHRWRGEQMLEPLPQTRWRAVFWLSLWLIVPTYGFYCRSIPGFVSPLAWLEFPMTLLPSGMQHYLQIHHWPWVLVGLILIAGIVAAAWQQCSRAVLLRGLEKLAVFAVVIGICWGVYAGFAHAARAAAAAGKPWESVWVPRYMGVIWPAMALIVAALLMRLPTWPVRAGAIAMFLGINLFYGGTRIFSQTEPPTNVMANDAFAAENPANHQLTWTNLRPARTEPGGGNLLGEVGEYYLQSLKKDVISPEAFRGSVGRLRRKGPRQTSLPSDRDIPADCEHLIVWNQYEPNEPNPQNERDMTGWQLRSDISYTVRDFWIWQDLARYRRREYVRSTAE